MALRAIYILFEIPLFFDSPCRSASQTITEMLLAVMRIVMTVMMEVTGMLLTMMIMLLT